MALTVGQLREALEGVNDDVEIEVSIPHQGGDLDDEIRDVVGADMATCMFGHVSTRLTVTPVVRLRAEHW